MKLLVGLGNPGKEYEATRHNVGWLVLDALANKLGAGECRHDEKFEADVLSARLTDEILPNPPLQKEGTPLFAKEGLGEISRGKILLIKPTTYMNNSGRSVERIRAYYKIEPADIVAIHDELDLPLGTIRTRLGGSTAGHNGVGSLIHHMGTDAFWRVRVGIDGGQPSRLADTVNYVLQSFASSEQELLAKVVDATASNLLDWLGSGEMNETSFVVN